MLKKKLEDNILSFSGPAERAHDRGVPREEAEREMLRSRHEFVHDAQAGDVLQQADEEVEHRPRE